MFVLGLLSLIIGSGSVRLTPDSMSGSRTTHGIVRGVAEAAPAMDTEPAGPLVAPADTNRKRPKVVEVSEWYSRRLTIHRDVAYATIPVFAVQYAAGEQLFKKSSNAPTWAKTFHRVGATALAGMFTVNTVTGLWNLWDSRSVSQGRVLRTVHALAMLSADGAFTYAGAKLSNEAETSADKRSLHRTIALSAMGVTIASGVAMKLWNH
jgi:hypothetical protein